MTHIVAVKKTKIIRYSAVCLSLFEDCQLNYRVDRVERSIQL